MPSCFLRPCSSPSGMTSGSPHEVGHTSCVLMAQMVGCCWWCKPGLLFHVLETVVCFYKSYCFLIHAFISHSFSGFPYSVQCLFRLFGMSGCLVNSLIHIQNPPSLINAYTALSFLGVIICSTMVVNVAVLALFQH